MATSCFCSRPAETERKIENSLVSEGKRKGWTRRLLFVMSVVDPHPVALTENIDKDFIQMESQQGLLKSLKVVAYCSENVPLETRVHWLLALIAIWP